MSLNESERDAENVNETNCLEHCTILPAIKMNHAICLLLSSLQDRKLYMR